MNKQHTDDKPGAGASGVPDTPAENSKDDVQDAARRKLMVRGGMVAGGMAAFAAGYGETVTRAVKGLAQGTAGVPTAHAVRGNSLTPEFRIDPLTGVLSAQPGQTVSPSSCLGCWTQCGVRLRVDTKENRILRVAGNPYHPLATTRPAAMETPVREVYAQLGGDNGLEGRATSCARGSAMLEQMSSPFRVLQPMKRVGGRGEGKWESITFEQLVQEVCEGGDLFGEGHVEGLRAVFDRDTLLDPDNPEYGAKVNQFLFTDASNEGRTPLIQRFAAQSFGTVNFSNHGSYCGQSFRVGAGAALGDLKGMPHGKPDWDNARFGLFIGASPAQAGNPFQRQARQLAEARVRPEAESFTYVVVSPMLPASSSLSAGPGNEWLPVNPAGDLALAMGLIRWILDHERFDARMLAQPGPNAMKAAGEAAWTNATHLVVAEPGHPRLGSFVRGADLGWPRPADADEKWEDVYAVRLEDGTLAPHTAEASATVFVDERIAVPGMAGGAQTVRVCSSLALLREESHRKSLDEYAELSGVPAAKIASLAERFTSYGKRAVADAHGGTMSGAGFYTAYAIAMLNTLVGNLNVDGGLVLDAGPFPPYGLGPRYNIAGFANKATPKGVALSRNRFPYEKSSEFKRKKAAGQPAYPASAPWYPATGGLSSEMLASALAGYPYRAKVWFNHMSNPIYGIAGLKSVITEKMKDPRILPLSVSINPFINETNALADYIVPDTVTYESWGVSAPWADVVAKASTVRWPVVQPRVARTATNEPVCLETFLIACAKRLGMPGFGDNAISDKDGAKYALDTPEDFFLRGMANIAFSAGRAVPEATDDDMTMTGVDHYRSLLQQKLKPGEWRQVAMLMSRGGRFDKMEDAWVDKGQHRHTRHAHAKPLQVWSEELAGFRHAMTGERYSGCPTWYPARLADGRDIRVEYPAQQWPFLLSSFKSNLMSSLSIGVNRLRQVHPHNPVSINRQDGERLGIRNGDAVRIVTPGGAVTGLALLRDGIQPGAVGIEHGYGHTELGARAHVVDGKPMPHDPALAAGVNLNDLGFGDVTRGEHANVWIDWVSGAAVRQGLPARIERV
ncbi:tetrathionate reductase subunit A [Achromobacter pestifer]|uniref:Tetrathionate reductase subunit A n=1 Tax=Achromobacter pestifer TaxID=1353889 RepID=A0A6S7A2P8_9BURK|nr:tetrathionate reductase subunit A [Achromobacter pestifer]CAB3709854.1 Tetrathionate reductase subunit A [Achromobacter pestifer]